VSDNKLTDADPMLLLLQERLAIVDAEIAERRGRRVELLDLIEIASDGRSRVNRQRKQRAAGNSSAADGEKPQPSFLRPDADAAAEQETA
jgi:hypothetical protein